VLYDRKLEDNCFKILLKYLEIFDNCRIELLSIDEKLF